MAKKIKSVSEMNKQINQVAYNMLDGARDDLAEELRENTLQLLYEDMDSGDYYERSYGFLNSIETTQVKNDNRNGKKQYYIQTGFNPKKMGSKNPYYSNKKKMFGVHTDFNKKKQTQSLVKWLEEGHEVPNTGEQRDGAHMIEATRESVKDMKTDNNIKAWVRKTDSGIRLTKKRR